MSTSTLISVDNNIGLMAVLCGIVALAICLEQRYKWAAKLTGCILVLLTTLILSNLRIIPEDAPAYGFVGTYLVPMALPLLLFRANIREIAKNSGRLLILFLLSACGTMLGSVIAFFTVGRFIPEVGKFLAMITGSYIGGGINFVAMAENYGASGTMVSTANVADAITMMFFFFALMTIPSMAFFKRHFRHPIEDHLATVEGQNANGKTNAANYWSRKEISLKDIALALGISVVIVAVSTPLADFFSAAIPTGNFFLNFCNALLGSKYLIITLIAVVAATVFHKQLNEIKGAQEFGTYFIYMFFATMSAPVSLRLLVNDAPIFFVCCIIIVGVNIIVTLVFTKLLKFGIEDAMVASNANVGGASTAAALAIAKGWDSLVVPGILVGTLGNVIGNICGILIGTIFGA
ncbi:DUF819 domain-containing protein [Diplocloster agilis]|uniref:DUF819 family protein n=1 Tax=Diplocloster agilis TaxID=2850323 RepID=A0A949NFI6_9FIRM|nr:MULTISPECIES: DUF819 family protein [Lachnospiraceae]MBU9738481.1 DUF819 family protein [Diplocloster agilis]MBU9745022.1 DUF819 family protein [Diplocloster agilis]MCU6736517.1 DUF819 family protein [Suonthocola fibrivorans]SCJ91272.1 Predicted integral membrane protein [uncultured Clostridium sp.]